jgi:Tfp pilus assembly protein PilO
VKELSKREKIIAAIVGLVAIGFLVNRFVLEPQSKNLRKLRRELVTLNEQSSSIGPKLVDFNKLNSDLIAKKGRLAELEQALSYKAGTAGIIHKVSREAKIRGLQIQQLRPQTDTVMRTRNGKRGDFRQLLLNVRMRGQYQQLGAFLQSLETQPFYVKVDEMNLKRAERRSAVLDITLKLEIVVRS